MLGINKLHITLIITASCLFLFSILSIIAFTEPESANVYIFILLYLSIFLFTTGLFTLASLFGRQKFLNNSYADNLSVSIRQGALIGVCISSLLFLNANNLLYWWLALTVIVLLLIVEIFFNLK